MKKFISGLAVLICATVACSLFVFPKVDISAQSKTPQKNSVLTLADNDNNAPNAEKILETRFLNMLNHNFVYGDAFYSIEDIVNSSMPALLSLKDGEDSSYIKAEYVVDYIYNMYGVEITDFSSINSDFEQQEGYVYILPVGYEIYKHKIVDVSQNEDGTYSVKTQAGISTHDGQTETELCETLFVRNTNSQFGFNIVRSQFVKPCEAL